MESIGSVDDNDLKATELRLGLPGRDVEEEEEDHNSKTNKRSLSDQLSDVESEQKGFCHKKANNGEGVAAAAKSQIVGWPPVRFSRKNSFQLCKKTEEKAGRSGIYVKVSMDGAPFLRKMDLKGYSNYPQLVKAIENMFKLKIGEYMEKEGYKGSEYAPAYEDKDGDLMLVGDVPWDFFISSCKRLRIIKRI